MAIARRTNLWGKITILLIICCLVTVGLCVDTALALDGSGTVEDPWRIKSLADFNDFAADANYWDDYTRLETDVNLAGPIYSTAVIAQDVNNANYEFEGTAFTGVFDGNDHKIMKLTIDDGGAGNSYLGLFGYINDGEVRNLGIEGGSVSGDLYVGGLVGWKRGSVSNCYSTGDVDGTIFVGGLAGYNWIIGILSSCFWDTDTQTHGVTESIGLNEGTVTNVSGLPTAQMQMVTTFTSAGWDFVDIWDMGQIYPFLRRYLCGDLNFDGVIDLVDFAIYADHYLGGTAH